MNSASRVVLALILAAIPSAAQLKPGTFLAVTNSAIVNDRAVFVVDRFANTSQRLTIQNINWTSVEPMRTFIENANNFLLTVHSGLSHVYRVTYSSGSWRASLLTSTGMPNFLWDIVRVGNTIYMTRSLGGNTATDGEIWSLPAMGGAPRVYVPIGPTIIGMPMAMVAVGTDLHVFMWDGPNARRGAHVTVNTALPSPVVVQRGFLPYSIPYTCRKLTLLPREAVYDTATGLLVIVGRAAEVLWRTTGGVDVRHDTVVPTLPCVPPFTNWGNALALNTDTGAILVGDADRSFEEKVCTQGVWKANVQVLPVAAGTRIQGLEYFPSGSLYREVARATGCKQSNGMVPCNYINSLPTGGNTRFAITVETSSRMGFLVIGARQTAINLTPVGAPGCWLGASLDLGFPGTATATGLQFTIPIPANLPPGTKAYAQWLLADQVNALGLVTSDTRVIKP